MTKNRLLIVAFFLIGGCAAKNNNTVSIDFVPMYGGVDRSSIPQLADDDLAFIKSAVKKFGSREEASQNFVDIAFQFYLEDDFSMAMKRFNQAWLLNDTNPEVYHGFGSVLYDQDENCEAMEIMNKSLGLDWGNREYNRPGFLADLAMVTSLCASSVNKDGQPDKRVLIEKSDLLFLESESIVSTAYLYDKWWQALYWRSDFSGAWEKVFKMRERGGEPDPENLESLRHRMPEPRQ